MSRDDSTTHAKPRSPCPYCGRENDCASEVSGGGGPRPMDVSVCLSCGEILLLDDDLRERKPTDPERLALMLSESWPTVEKTRREILMMIQRRATTTTKPTADPAKED